MTSRLSRAGGVLARRAGAVTSGLRSTPSVLVAGTQRGGTTSLFRSLRQHPLFLGPIHRKGVHYFDVEFHRGPAWYVGHFPLRATAAVVERRHGGPAVVGEASPYYMAHPLAAQRIGAALPGVKVVVVLRDPIERAFSAYKHERARGFESLEFAEALLAEPGRIAGEEQRIRADPGYQSHALRHNAYLTRGQYVEQLRRLEGHLGRENILVLDSHRIFADPAAQFEELLRFVGLPAFDGFHHDHHNARPSRPMPAEQHELLARHFEPHDRELADWLGWSPSWMSGPGR